MEQTSEKQNNLTGTAFDFVVEDSLYTSPNQYVIGKQVKQIASLPEDADVYLSVEEPWEDQRISNDDEVDLGRPMLHFYVRKNLPFTINKQPFSWHRQYITGDRIRTLGKIDRDLDLYLSIEKPGADELIGDDTRVNLALPGTEHFVSKERVKEFDIIVNGIPKKWEKEKISFKDVVILAYGNYIDRPTMVYTVAYEDGPKENPEGSMNKHSIVFVKNKMIFHATATDKS